MPAIMLKTVPFSMSGDGERLVYEADEHGCLFDAFAF